VAAVSSHYYAVLLLMPLAIGEGVRAGSLRRLDLPIWLALDAAMLPLVLHLPLLTRTYHKAATLQTYPAFWPGPRGEPSRASIANCSPQPSCHW
jgi:hypothetical protein